MNGRRSGWSTSSLALSADKFSVDGFVGKSGCAGISDNCNGARRTNVEGWKGCGGAEEDAIKLDTGSDSD